MKAWIENAQIRDICHGNPAELYHPAVAGLYTTDVPDDAANGDGWVNGVLVKPVVAARQTPPPPVVIPPKVSPVEFKMLFTTAERIAIRAARATNPSIDDFFDILEDPRLTEVNLALVSNQQGLGYLESVGLLAEGRSAEILTGVLK